jgi:hypothetical protein
MASVTFLITNPIIQAIKASPNNADAIGMRDDWLKNAPMSDEVRAALEAAVYEPVLAWPGSSTIS